MRRGIAVFVAGVMPLLLGACGPPTYHALKAPPTTLQPPTGLDPPRDYSGLRLAVLPGNTTTSQPNVNGKATLNGTVTSSGAPVVGATVMAERYAGGNNPASKQTVATGADGSYSLQNLMGGRYRLRAFRTPDMGMASGQVFFLGNTDTKTINMSIDQFVGYSMSSAIAPNPPIFSALSNIAVRVTQRNVDGDGNISAVGVQNVAVTLSALSPITVNSAGTQFTDSNGDAVWSVTCGALGASSATFTIAGSPPLISQLPPCSPPPTTTTPTTVLSSTTTTVR